MATKTGPGGTELLVRPAPPAQKEVPKESPTEPQSPESAAARLRQAVEDAQRAGLVDQLEQACHQRRQFWIDTCRDVLEMRVASPQVLELHRQQGCRFCAPAPQQIQHVLDALDSALPGWDREHLALFYRTLELNYPELVRPCRAQRRS